MPGLGLDGSICSPQMRLRGRKAYILLLFFCYAENQAVWLALGRDLWGHSPFGSLSCQKPSAATEINAGFELIHTAVGIFQQNYTPFQRYLGPL